MWVLGSVLFFYMACDFPKEVIEVAEHLKQGFAWH